MNMPSPVRIAALIAFAAFGDAGALAADPLPQTRTELMQSRAQIGPRADMFGARALAQTSKPAKAGRIAGEKIDTPPPLPFTYGGSGTVNGKPVLFLERQSQSVLVHVGDIVEGAYRVEAVGRDRALLRYLPLDLVVVMSFGPAGAVAQPVVPAAPQSREPLFVNLPDALPFGQERPLALGIAPGSAAARATIEITYDANEVAVSGAKIMRPGRAVVEVNSQTPTPAKAVHLKAIAEEAVQTEIGIAVVAFDAQGRSVEIRGMPAQHIISLGSAN